MRLSTYMYLTTISFYCDYLTYQNLLLEMWNDEENEILKEVACKTCD